MKCSRLYVIESSNSRPESFLGTASAGQPVQPSDEIDVDKEYELIPIEESYSPTLTATHSLINI